MLIFFTAICTHSEVSRSRERVRVYVCVCVRGESMVSDVRISTRWKKAHSIYNIEAAEVKGELCVERERGRGGER